MITKPEPKPSLPDRKPIEPWAQPVYPKGYDPEEPGTFAEMEEIDVAIGRTDPEHKPPKPEPIPEPKPEPLEDPNYTNMTPEQRLDALLGGWLSPDGTINYDSPLCPFK